MTAELNFRLQNCENRILGL